MRSTMILSVSDRQHTPSVPFYSAQSNNNQENDNGIETRITEIRGPRYVVLLTLLALNSSLSFHSPRSSAMNFFQTLPGKENELRSYYLYF